MEELEGLEEKLQSVLSDPAQMEQIMRMAQALGLGAPPDGRPDGKPEPEEGAKTDDTPPVQGALREPVAQLLRQAGKLDAREENLLNALKPFLKPSRREKIDRAMQVARLSHLAGYALRSRGDGHT